MLKNFESVSLILCAGALFLSGGVYANIVPVKQGTSISQQDGKVTGTVEDDFGPVTGASVVVKGTTNGTITDMKGNFSLEGVKNGDVIQISFIGLLHSGDYIHRPASIRKISGRHAKAGRGCCHRFRYETFGKGSGLCRYRVKR